MPRSEQPCPNHDNARVTRCNRWSEHTCPNHDDVTDYHEPHLGWPFGFHGRACCVCIVSDRRFFAYRMYALFILRSACLGYSLIVGLVLVCKSARGMQHSLNRRRWVMRAKHDNKHVWSCKLTITCIRRNPPVSLKQKHDPTYNSCKAF